MSMLHEYEKEKNHQYPLSWLASGLLPSLKVTKGISHICIVKGFTQGSSFYVTSSLKAPNQVGTMKTQSALIATEHLFLFHGMDPCSHNPSER